MSTQSLTAAECTFPDLTPMEELYKSNGFSAQHSIEQNVYFAAASRQHNYAPDHGSRGKIAAVLCGWYTEVETECSTMYEALRASNPDTPKPELNTNPELLALNTLRRAIRNRRSRFTH